MARAALLLVDKLRFLEDRLFPPRALSGWINVDNIRRWITTCEEKHGAHCNLSPRSRNIFRYKPKWLVDVNQSCLVQVDAAEKDYRYLALSYVWGSSTPFRTLRQNLAQLQEPGSLLQSSFSPSAAVAHAIHLARLLGETHLWVDTLCIVQDDGRDRQEHLAGMGSIYANAFATIVAAGGVAGDGLHGLQGTAARPSIELDRSLESVNLRRPESYGSPRIQFLHEAIVMHHDRLKHAAWSSRGWTFQEQIFSRRLIVMDKALVAWDCHCAVWFEDDAATGDEVCAANTDVVAEGFSFHQTPTFADYKEHASQFNMRLFTYPEDAMDAFAGIVAVLSTSSFKGGFCCCLPVMFFDAALLWSSVIPMQKRLPRADAPGEGDGNARPKRAPTWSWAAWQGAIRFPEVAADSETIVRPLASWEYRGPESEGAWIRMGQLQRVDGQHVDGQHNAKVSDDALDEMIHQTASLCTEPTPEPGTRKDRHLLRARLQRIFLNVNPDRSNSAGIVLENDAGRYIGVLKANEEVIPGHSGLGNQGVDGQSAKTLRCELVAISEAAATDSYNVLWISRDRAASDDGIAYRKGMGSIYKEDWAALQPQLVDIVLG